MKVGYITIIGKPNVGKSTLINKLVGYKVAITAPKPQTTRYNIKGIITTDTSQMIFIDTPGVHNPRHKLGEYMMQGVTSALKYVDVVLYLVDATKSSIDEISLKLMENLVKSNSKVILCINKIDKIRKDKILDIIKEYDSKIKEIGGEFKEILPISIYKNDGIDLLKSLIEKYLKEGELLYSEDDITDLTEREIVEELIREKALKYLDKEVPHGIKVQIEKFEETKNENGKDLVKIDVEIICEKMSHKSIIIGKDGSMLKNIINDARREAQNMFMCKFKITPWVKVRTDWQMKESYLSDVKGKI